MIEEVYKFGESRLEPTLESCLNLQANHNEGFAQRLTDVELILAEVTVRQEEERDGRLNEKYDVFFVPNTALNLYDEFCFPMTSHDIRCLILSFGVQPFTGSFTCIYLMPY
jgi:hypothetical protein